MVKSEEQTVRFRRLPRAVREQQILDAAVAVFSRRGYHAASMDEIADTARISKPMLYAYLGSKEELFAASIRREVQRLVDAINTDLRPGLRPDEQLWRGLRALFTFVDSHRESWRVLYRQARNHGGPFAAEVARMRNLVIDLVADLLARAVREHNAGVQSSRQGLDHDVTAMAHALVGAGESLADWMLDHPEESSDTTAARLMNFAWTGFGSLLNGAVWRPDHAVPTREQAHGLS